MKAHVLFMVCFTVAFGFPAHAERLEVHEWGTFTVVSGSDGIPIQWYQPQKALSELPTFVHPQRVSAARIPGVSVVSKSGSGTLFLSQGFYVRMETPVIYFYPEKPMTVRAEVTMKQGNVTEWFPEFTVRGADGMMRWDGELVAPTDRSAAERIPRIEGVQGAHYGHAREVPDAWLFHGKTSSPATAAKLDIKATKDAPAAEKSVPSSWEKFIFYRGAGDALPPYRVEAHNNGTVRLMHYGDGGEISTAFVLDVRSEGARWARFGRLTEMKDNKGLVNADRDLNMPALPIARAQEELAAAMETALNEAGLTKEEAKAMVATWRDVWFTETGTRVLAILPRAWVDSVLPLTITPTPEKLTRVFVGRFEVFTPEREQTLLTLLGTKDKPDTADADKFRSLHLDRFANAALVRAQRISEDRMRARFFELQSAPVHPATAAR